MWYLTKVKIWKDTYPVKEENLFPALLPPSNVSYLTTKGMFDFPEKDTMEVWVNGVVVETAVSSHYKKKTSWNKIDNKEEYKWIFVSLDNKGIFHLHFSEIQVWFIVHCPILRFQNQNQSQFCSDHKFSTLSQRLSQVNMAGIFLSHKLTKSVPKHPHLGPEVQIHSLDWALGTGTEYPTPYKISFLVMFTTELWDNILTWCNKLFCWCSACIAVLTTKYVNRTFWGSLNTVFRKWYVMCKLLIKVPENIRTPSM